MTLTIEEINHFIDFSNIQLNDNISIYLINKFIITENDLIYYPFSLFKTHYKFTNEIKSNIINLINDNMNNLNDYNLIDNLKLLIIHIICNSNPNCLCPIIYKYKSNFNDKFNNYHNIIKKIINAGKIQDDFNKSIELRLEIQENLNNSLKMRLNNYKIISILFGFSIYLLIIYYIYIDYEFKY